MLRGVRAPAVRPAPRAGITQTRVPPQAIRMASRAARSVASMTNTRFSASRMRVAVEQTNKLLSSRSGLRSQTLSVVPIRLYAKDIEYPDWEQYEKFDKYEYRGEMHEEHQFWDPDSVVPDWDDNISLAEVGYGLFSIAAALFVLYLFANLTALYTPDPNMLESSLTPFGRHWVERGYSPAELPPIPAGRNEGLAAHNIYTLPNALDAIENRPGVQKH